MKCDDIEEIDADNRVEDPVEFVDGDVERLQGAGRLIAEVASLLAAALVLAAVARQGGW